MSSHSDLQTDIRINTAINFLERKDSKGDTNVKICFIMVGVEKKAARCNKVFLHVGGKSTCVQWKTMLVNLLKFPEDCMMEFYSEKIYEDEHKADNVNDVIMKARTKKRKENLCYVLTYIIK